MNERARPLKTFADIMTKVGSFLFYWSGLEQGLTNAIAEMRASLGEDAKPVKGNLAKRLDIWVQLMERNVSDNEHLGVAMKVVTQALAIKDVRNIIVHGLRAGSSDDGPAFIECAIGGYEDPTGEIVRYSLIDLEHYTEGIDACRVSESCRPPCALCH